MTKTAHITKDSSFFIGEDKVFRFTITDADDVVVDITGWTLEWVLRQRPYSTAATLTKTTASGISITDGEAGVCEVTVTDTDTENLEPGTYHHTLKRTDPGNETVLADGDAVLQLGSTR